MCPLDVHFKSFISPSSQSPNGAILLGCELHQISSHSPIALSMIRIFQFSTNFQLFFIKKFPLKFPSTLPNGFFFLIHILQDYMKISNLGRKEIS
jgi:hypothetical protein